jgi:hypothetical protein
VLLEKCLVVHSHPILIPHLSTWTNNVRDNRESVVGPYFFNNIIGPRRQGWDRNGMRVYNQAFLNILNRIMVYSIFFKKKLVNYKALYI